MHRFAPIIFLNSINQISLQRNKIRNSTTKGKFKLIENLRLLNAPKDDLFVSFMSDW